MYKSLGSQFFRTTTGIQSGTDAFNIKWAMVLWKGVYHQEKVIDSSKVLASIQSWHDSLGEYYTNSWPCIVPLRVNLCVPVASTELYVDKCTENQICKLFPLKGGTVTWSVFLIL